MKTKRMLFCLAVSLLMVVALVLSSCQAGTVEEKKEAAKTEEEEAAGPEMVRDVKGRLVEKPQYGGTVTVIRPADVTTWDPLVGSSDGANGYIGAGSVYEMLTIGDWSADRTKNDFTTNYVPPEFQTGYALLESYENPDPLTYIIHIRKGVHYQNKSPVNGRELTTTDIKYSIDRLLCLEEFADENPLPRSFYPRWVTFFDRAEIVDKYTIIFHLKEPWAVFPEYFGAGDYMPYIHAREVRDTYGENFPWEAVVSWGPWQVVDVVPGSSVTYDKNPTYYGHDESFPENQIPYADHFKILIISDASTQLAALRTGKVDHSRGISVSLTDALDPQETQPQLMYKMFSSTAPAIEVRYDLEPWSDIRVRRAMQMAIDIPAINDSYYYGLGGTFPSMVTSAWPDYYTPFEEFPEEVQEAFTYNPERAKELLAEAGYPNGFRQNLPLSSATSPETRDLTDLFVNYWEAIGITTNIQTRESAAHSTFIYSGDQEMNWMACFCNWIPGEIMGWYYGGQEKTAWNFGSANDPVFNKYLDDAMVEPDPAKRTQLFKEGFARGTSQFFYIAGPSRVGYIFWQPWMKNYNGELRINAWGYGQVYARVWIDQDLKYEMTGARD